MQPGGNGRRVICPECRADCAVPAEGVGSFQSAYRINSLTEVHSILRDEIESDRAAPNKEVRYCPDHEAIEVQLYCWTCSQFICWKCAYSDGQHHSHHHCKPVTALQDCEESFKPGVKALCDAVQQVLERTRCGVPAAKFTWSHDQYDTTDQSLHSNHFRSWLSCCKDLEIPCSTAPNSLVIVTTPTPFDL